MDERIHSWDTMMHFQGSRGQEGVGGIDDQAQLCGIRGRV